MNGIAQKPSHARPAFPLGTDRVVALSLSLALFYIFPKGGVRGNVRKGSASLGLCDLYLIQAELTEEETVSVTTIRNGLLTDALGI